MRQLSEISTIIAAVFTTESRLWKSILYIKDIRQKSNNFCASICLNFMGKSLLCKYLHSRPFIPNFKTSTDKWYDILIELNLPFIGSSSSFSGIHCTQRVRRRIHGWSLLHLTVVTKTLVVTDEPLTLTLREIFADLTGFLKMVVVASAGEVSEKRCLLMLQEPIHSW